MWCVLVIESHPDLLSRLVNRINDGFTPYLINRHWFLSYHIAAQLQCSDNINVVGAIP